MLTLRVLTLNGAAPPAPLSATFDPAGGTVGRADGNRLVLPDPERTVSRVHAQVVCRGGAWSLVDRGSNPVLVNGHPLEPGEEAPLAAGDRVEIGGYALVVAFEAAAAQPVGSPVAAPAPPPLGAGLLGELGGLGGHKGLEGFGGLDGLDRGGGSGGLDGLDGLGGPAAPPRGSAAAPTDGLQALVGSGAPAEADPFAVLFGGGGGHGGGNSGNGSGGAAWPNDPLAGSELAPTWSAPNTAHDADPLAALAGEGAAPPAAPQADSLPGWREPFQAPPVARQDAAAGAEPPVAGSGAQPAVLLPDDLFGDLLGAEAGASAWPPATAPRETPERPLAPEPVDSAPSTEARSSAAPPPGPAGFDSAVAQPAAQTFPPVPDAAPALSASLPPAASVPVPAPAPATATAPTAAPATATRPAPATDADALLAALCQGLGLARSELPDTLTPELMRAVGSLLRESVDGTLALLLARAMTKREVRAEQTVIVGRENNPLKFSPTVEVALAHLLGPLRPGFLPPGQAMREAYDDLRAHQFGVMAGMRAALEGVLARYAPDGLQARLEPPGRLEGLLPSGRKARLWDSYLNLHATIAAEAEDDFQQLFGRAFLRAYESQVALLAQGREAPAAINDNTIGKKSCS